MTQGFYEQLGVAPAADAEALRTAYHRQVARLARRTRQLAEQGGDTSQLDLARAQLDEAWAVLSDPARRQSYDAMVELLDGELPPGMDAESLWESIGDAVVPPAVAAAVAILGKATQLDVPEVGRPPALPEARRPAPAAFRDEGTTPTLSPFTAVTEATEVPSSESPSRRARTPEGAPVIPVARPRPVAKLRAVPDPGQPDLRVVDGSAGASSVIVLPPDAPRQKTLTPEEVAQLTDRYGYSGGLLRAVREAKGITLDDVAASTRISVRYLEAIEADAHDRLPSATFVKGYVREVSKLLKLDEESVVAGYMRRLG